MDRRKKGAWKSLGTLRCTNVANILLNFNYLSLGYMTINIVNLKGFRVTTTTTTKGKPLGVNL